ncbi:MAG TPA: type II toxin-antitoxin system VapC family toxin [Bryobacteraceae bacterium]|nr:type II toxin-antitoxin system VapC family toxin [Bryobacteraceae bacterium]
MRILVDTHTFIWWNEASPRLSRRASALLADSRSTLLLSVVSAWELVVKVEAKKLKLPEPPSVYVPTRTAHYGMEILPVTLAHCLAVEALPPYHRDPFDRMLIAQAQVEQLPILTIDEEMGRYGVKTLW